jgi:hypothetical protein
MQGILVVVAAALLGYAGYSLGVVRGYADGKRAGTLDAPRPPSPAQTIVLALIGAGALGGALALQGGGVRAPTPARLHELTGRAEAAAIRRAEQAAETRSGGDAAPASDLGDRSV